MERMRLEITGMTCEHCARTIAKHLEKEPGVQEAKVDWRTGQAEVLFDPSVTTRARIVEGSVFARQYKAKVAA